jgi:hypothetical protein
MSFLVHHRVAQDHDGKVRLLPDPGSARRAREAFDATGYTLEAITERLGAHVFAHLSAGEVAPLVRATRAGDRLDVLARLFLLGDTVAVGDAAAALAPLSVDEGTAGGLTVRDGDAVQARVAIRPLGEPDHHLVVHDFTGRSLGADHVLGISASTMGLAGATIRRPVGAAFDLGTGCGIQALHAASHSARVVAGDINPRAVAMATLTMELNGLDNVSVRHGDRFDPVEDDAFELIVANPPFVISPSRRYLFRDGGLDVDELCRSIVRRAPEHLAARGHCQLLASWAHIEGEDWRERLADWFVGTGCDALILEREALEPPAHAASWLRQTERPDRWADEYDAWLAYDEEHHIEAVGFGLITMRKRVSGEPWFRAETAPQELVMPCGDQLGAMFELADFLEAHPGDALLDVKLRVAPDVALDERARPTVGGWLVTQRQLRQTSGLCHEGDVDPGVAAIVGACDSNGRLGDVLARAAAESNVDRRAMTGAALPIVRRLVEQAFLLPSLDA